MADAKRTGKPGDGTAEHAGTAAQSDRHKPEPGSGLDHRISRNSASTAQSQDAPATPVDPDSSNRKGK